MDKLPEDLFQPFEESAFETDLAKLKWIDRIIELRPKTGLSQQDLGLRIGKDKSFIENLENKNKKIKKFTNGYRDAYPHCARPQCGRGTQF